MRSCPTRRGVAVHHIVTYVASWENKTLYKDITRDCWEAMRLLEIIARLLAWSEWSWSWILNCGGSSRVQICQHRFCLTEQSIFQSYGLFTVTYSPEERQLESLPTYPNLQKKKSYYDDSAKKVDPSQPAFTRRREVFVGRLASKTISPIWHPCPRGDRIANTFWPLSFWASNCTYLPEHFFALGRVPVVINWNSIKSGHWHRPDKNILGF